MAAGRILICWLLSCAATLLPVRSELFAQNPADATGNDDAELILKVYRVADLLIWPRDYPFDATLPGVPQRESVAPSAPAGVSGAGGFGGQGFGGGFGGMGRAGSTGGGFFNINQQATDPNADSSATQGLAGVQTDASANSATESGIGTSRGQFTINDLKHAITDSIDPESWDTVGGNATCTTLGSMLLISQTARNHEKIEQFLKTVRAEVGSARVVTIHATWLVLDNEQADALIGESNKRDNRTAITVAPTALQKLRVSQPGYEGRISCFDGQRVHIVSGTRRTVSMSAIPTVGDFSVGYSPVVSVLNSGVLLEVTAATMPDRETALLDLRSVVSQWNALGDPIRITSNVGVVGTRREPQPAQAQTADNAGSSAESRAADAIGQVSVAVDRLDMPVQQWASTVQVPLGKPVLVGGVSLLRSRTNSADEGVAASSPMLYLFVETTLTNPKPAPELHPE